MLIIYWFIGIIVITVVAFLIMSLRDHADLIAKEYYHWKLKRERNRNAKTK